LQLVTNALRDDLKAAFRWRICERLNVTPFEYQAEWWLASDGLALSTAEVEGAETIQVRNPDDSISTRWIIPRPLGHARFLAALGAFKVGKSWGAAMWGAGFACVPGARVSLVGLEYDICEPEFHYICEALLSERGLGLKASSLADRARDGKMWLDLANGARIEAKSWERREALKGKELDAYIYCEAYQLPGIECFTNFSQNLRVRQGYAVFATTPDRPWVKQLHELGHGADAEWHCTCGVAADVNPYSFDARAKIRDAGLMTREKYAIHYEGKIGDFVGHVYNYQRGGSLFTAATHPHLFDKEGAFKLPQGWEVISGVDTGTFYTAVVVAFSPAGEAFVLAELPNYRYVAGQPERNEDISIPMWANAFSNICGSLGARPVAFADKNSQFKRELNQYGIALLPSTLPLEARTEITREYFQQGRIWLDPSLSVLPFELENACWPEEASAAGRFQRIKDRDHTLDCLEHILSRRPRGKRPITNVTGTWLEQFQRAEGGKKAKVHGSLPAV
jgi:hypothetical protein